VSLRSLIASIEGPGFPTPGSQVSAGGKGRGVGHSKNRQLHPIADGRFSSVPSLFGRFFEVDIPATRRCVGTCRYEVSSVHHCAIQASLLMMGPMMGPSVYFGRISGCPFLDVSSDEWWLRRFLNARSAVRIGPGALG